MVTVCHGASGHMALSTVGRTYSATYLRTIARKIGRISAAPQEIPLLIGSSSLLSTGMAGSVMVRAQDFAPDSSRDVEWSGSFVSGGNHRALSS